MRVFFLAPLLVLMLFSCGNKKVDFLSERLELINGTEEHNNYILIKSNEQLFLKLTPQHQERLGPIKSQTAEIIAYSKTLKSDMIEKSGGMDPKTMILVNARDFNFPYEFIMNSRYKLTFKNKMNSLPNLISEMGIFEAPSVVIDGKDDPFWSLIPNQKAKSTFELLFEETNLPAALTSISQIENRILQYERKVYEITLLQELDSLREIHQPQP